MDAAWVGVAGVAVGSALTFAGTQLSERSRERREDHRRWHEPRLQAYTTTLNQLTVLVVETRAAIAAARPRLQPPWGPYRLRRQIGSAQAALRLALDQLELIRLTGSRPVRDAAEKSLDVLGRMSESLSAWPGRRQTVCSTSSCMSSRKRRSNCAPPPVSSSTSIRHPRYGVLRLRLGGSRRAGHRTGSTRRRS